MNDTDTETQHDKDRTVTAQALTNLTATRVPEAAFAVRDEQVNHPLHYGGEQHPFEPIKIIEAWDLGFNTGNALKYLLRAGRKASSPYAEDLKKARFYLDREIQRAESGQ